MSDRPKNQNMGYIRRCLTEDCRKLEKKHGIKIVIDSDSRNGKGNQTIDTTILKKIESCDLFVCDITPIRKPWIAFNSTQEKEVPNPNVMYELGFAVSALGWSRCILVWNNKFGDVNHSPFDIRNYSTVTYQIGKKELSLEGVLNEKIKRYDELVYEWRLAKERSYDAERFATIDAVFPERELLDSIDNFLTNRVYSRYAYNKWDELIYQYGHYPDTHFVDEDIHERYQEFIDALARMESFAATYNKPLHSNKEYVEGMDENEWSRGYRYIFIDPYVQMDEDDARKVQRRIDDLFDEIGPLVTRTYHEFRSLIKKKLLI